MPAIRNILILVLFATPLTGHAKSDAPRLLKDAYEKTFSGIDSYNGQGKYNEWNDAIKEVKDLAEKAKDKTLSKNADSLFALNPILINAIQVWGREEKDLGRFEKVIVESRKARDELKSGTYVFPSKRAARDALVALANYLEQAALKPQVMVDLDKLSTIREINRLSKRFEGQIRLDQQDAQKELAAIQDEWIKKRRATLEEMKKKQSLKIEQLTGLQYDLTKVEENTEQVTTFLESLTPEKTLLMFSIFMVTGDPLKNAQDEAIRLNQQMAKARKGILSIQEGISRVDDLIKGRAPDLGSDRETQKVKEKIKDAEQNLKDIEQLFADPTKSPLAKLSAEAASLNQAFKTKTRALNCPALQEQGNLSAKLENCRGYFLTRVTDFSKFVPLKSCSLDTKSDDPAIEACAKSVGRSYLKLPVAASN